MAEGPTLACVNLTKYPLFLSLFLSPIFSSYYFKYMLAIQTRIITYHGAKGVYQNDRRNPPNSIHTKTC
jgi:hypothetical protein